MLIIRSVLFGVVIAQSPLQAPEIASPAGEGFCGRCDAGVVGHVRLLIRSY